MDPLILTLLILTLLIFIVVMHIVNIRSDVPQLGHDSRRACDLGSWIYILEVIVLGLLTVNIMLQLEA